MEDYGKRLCEIRKQIGYSQEQVALLAEITTSYYGQIERGTANPSISLLDKICKAMNVTLADIFTDAGIIIDGLDTVSRQILFQLAGKSDKEKELYLNVIRQINRIQTFSDEQK